MESKQHELVVLTFVICALFALFVITLLWHYQEIDKTEKRLARNLTLEQINTDAEHYNGCLQGCIFQIQTIYGKVNYESDRQEEIFLMCGDLCIDQFNQNFTKYKNGSTNSNSSKR